MKIATLQQVFLYLLLPVLGLQCSISECLRLSCAVHYVHGTFVWFHSFWFARNAVVFPSVFVGDTVACSVPRAFAMIWLALKLRYRVFSSI